MKIFVGSSKFKKPIATSISTALRRAGFEVFGWWERSVFQGGDVTIDRLIEMSDICDGAVLVFGADDPVNIGQGNNPSYLMAPRDNVILEYGIFVSKLGVRRALIVAESNVKVPTDLLGVFRLGRPGYTKDIVDTFKRVLRDAPTAANDDVTFHISRTLINVLMRHGEDSWVSRALYMGARGAQAWMAVECDTLYTGRREFNAVRDAVAELFKTKVCRSFDCIVSFGPGVGLLDKEIVPHIRGDQLLKYIPVDINPFLANRSAGSVENVSKCVHVPFCIIGDFEDGMSRITDTIHDRTGPGRVFMMLGGTFGNLEKSENTFLQGLYDAMDSGDIAILDVFTAGPSYRFDSDHLFPLSAQPDSVKRYLAMGVERRSGLAAETVVADINNHIAVSPMHNGGASAIANTHAFCIQCSKSREPVIYVRRYSFTSFSRHLEGFGFSIIGCDEVFSGSDCVGRGVFIIERRR